MRNLRKIFVLLLSLLLVSCVGFVQVTKQSQANQSQVTQSPTEQSPIIMTVFIHGTMSMPVSILGAARWVKSVFGEGPKDPAFDNISLFQRYVEIAKKCSYYKNQPLSKLGLVAIDIDKPIRKREIEYFGHKIAKAYQEVYNFTYPSSREELKFYIFSWSGRLSKWHRRRYSRELYDALDK